MAGQSLSTFYEIEKSWWTLPRAEYKKASVTFLSLAEKEKNDFHIGLGKYLMARYHANYESTPSTTVWGRFELAFSLIEESKDYLKKANQSHFISLLEGVRIKGCRHGEKWELAFQSMDEIDRISKLHTNHYVQGYGYYRKAQLLSDLNQFEDALTAYYSAAQHFKAGGFIGYGGVCHIHIANINSSLGHLKKALEHYEKVNQVVKKTSALHIANLACYGRFGLYIQQKDYDKALEITDSIQLLEKQLKAFPNQNIRNIHLSKVYKGKGEFEKAKSYIQSSLTYFQEQFEGDKPAYHMGSLHFQKGILEMKLGKNSFALADFRKAEAFTNISKDQALKGSVYAKMSNAFKLEEQFDSALFYLEKSKIMNDSVSYASNAKQMALLEAYYKNEGLLKEKALLKGDLDLSELKSKNNLIGLVAIAFGLTLSIILIVVYTSKKSLKQKNNILLFKEKLFRSQMNPHFIFNVLSAVQYSILQSDKKEAVSSLTKFGRLIRDVLESSREEFIGLDQEVRIIENYLAVQQTRLNGLFEFEINIDCSDELESVFVPPMLLQPIIENCIEHGFKQKKSNGFIQVEITQKGGQVFFLVKDNGKGFESDSKSKHNSVALSITRDRLKLFGSDDLKVVSVLDEGTEVSYSVRKNKVIV